MGLSARAVAAPPDTPTGEGKGEPKPKVHDGPAHDTRPGPGPTEPGTKPAIDSITKPATEPTPVVEPPPEPGAPLRARAAKIRALIEGTLDVEVDPASLFVVDLANPAFVGPSGERLRNLLAQLDAPPEPKRRRPTRSRTKTEPTSPPDPATELAEALEAFLSLNVEERAAVLATHRRRQQDIVADREAASRREARLAAVTRRADRLEAFLSGTLDLNLSPHDLLTVDLADPDEAALSSARRHAWSEAGVPTPVERTEPDSTKPTPVGPAPTKITPTGPTPTESADPGPELPPSEALAQAEARLDALRRRFLALPEADRAALFETHDRRRREAEQAQAKAATVAQAEAAAAAEAEAERTKLDEEAAAQIHTAEAEADAAAVERERALQAAKQASTKAKRILAEERARLLGIKEAQARTEADLNRRKTERIDNHERALEWRSRVTDLAQGPLFGAEREAEADGMYEGIRTELAKTRERLREELRRIRQVGSDIPTVGEGLDRDLAPDIDRGEITELREQLRAKEDELTRLEQAVEWELAQGLRDDVVLLNRTRLQLLELASPELHDEVTGFGERGLDQVRRELDQISVELGFHVLKIPRYGDLLVESLRASPFRVAVGVLELLVVLLGLSWWRRHAPGLERRIRQHLLRRRPLPRSSVLALSTLWYAERIRRPLEMLLVLWLLIELAGGVEDVPELMLLWIIVRWILIGLAVILLLDAVAARDTLARQDDSSDSSALRIHSLRVVGINVIAVGLLLSLTSAMVGRGAIYDWVWSTCWLLSVPVVLYLVYRWRPTIAERLAQRPTQGSFVKWARSQQTGLVQFVAAMAAAGFLLIDGISRWFMRHLGGLETTRRVLAYLFRREVAKLAAASAAVEATYEQVDPTCYAAFDPERPDPEPLADVAHDDLERVVGQVATPRSTLSAVVGERGMGKTTFLRRLQQRVGEDRIKVISCPEVGLAGLMERIAAIAGQGRSDGAADGEALEGQALVRALREQGPLVIAIDDAQRLIQPAIRGLRELDRLTAFAREVGGEVSWVITMGSAAWHYLQRARGDRVFFEQVVELPRWTEEQLGQMLRARMAIAGITPSFDGLVVPRQTEHIGGPAEGQRTESSYYRLLWDFARGNPAVVLHAFRESLLVGPSGDVIVRLFREPPAKEIEALSLPLLFVLRAVIQLDLARESELANATLLPRTDVSDALRFCVTRGYLEPYDEGFRVTWPWYRTITTVLQRQHLLST